MSHSEYKSQGQKILQVYTERLLKTRQALLTQELTVFEAEFPKVAMAYHNYLAYAAKAKQAGVDLAQDHDIASSLEQVRNLTTSLYQLLSTAKETMQRDLGDLNKKKSAFAAFQSGSGGAVRFIKGA